MTYEKSFKEEAVRLSDEIGVKDAAEQLGISYNTLSHWRYKQKCYGSQAYVGSGHKRMSADPKEQEIYQLRKENATERSKSAAAVWLRRPEPWQMAGKGYLPCAGGQRIRLLSLGQTQGQPHTGRTSFGGNQSSSGRASMERQLWGAADAAGAGSTWNPSGNPAADPNHAGERLAS